MNNEITIVVHQAIDITTPVLLTNFLFQEPQKPLPIRIAEADGLVSIAACARWGRAPEDWRLGGLAISQKIDILKVLRQDLALLPC